MASGEFIGKEDENQNESSIVVERNTHTRNNEPWTRPSSPESSPEVEPEVANLLPSANGPQNHLQHLESPEPDDPEDDEVSAGQVVREETDAKPVSFRDDDRMPLAGTSEERLLQMPEIRPLPWRDGVDPSSENLVGGDSRRKQIRFGVLLATRGEVQKVPCSTCLNGRGKFALCIALEGFFKGACASCQLSGGPNRCSIKQNDGEDGSPVGRPPDKNRKSSSNSIKRPSSREGSQPSQVKKRKKTMDDAEPVTEREGAQTQFQSEHIPSQTSTPVVQSPWATPQTSQTAAPMASMPASFAPIRAGVAEVGSNGFGRSVYKHPPPQPERHASSGNSPRPTPARRSSSGWATVNKPPTPQGEDAHPLKIHHSHYMPKTQQSQPLPQTAPVSHALPYPAPSSHQYPPQPPYHQSPYSAPPSSYQQPPPSPHSQPPHLPPPPQHPPYPPSTPQHYSPYAMPPPTQQAPPNNNFSSYSAPHPPPMNSPINPNSAKPPMIDLTGKEQPAGYSGTGPYIDSLPPAKQRQLYGIVTGIQVGIKHLQSELEVLKKALGMEDAPAGTGLR